MKPERIILKDIANLLFMPLRLLLPHEVANKISLNSIKDERVNMVLRFVKGRLLDIGCGTNLLVERYEHNGSIGVDVYDFKGGGKIIQNPAKLPFESNSFDTISFIASFNHIPNREEVLKETDRVLKKGGIVVVTMLSPFIGKLRHMMWWIDRQENDRYRHLKKEGEKDGLSYTYICNLFSKLGYRLKVKKTFLMQLNNIYIFERENK